MPEPDHALNFGGDALWKCAKSENQAIACSGSQALSTFREQNEGFDQRCEKKSCCIGRANRFCLKLQLMIQIIGRCIGSDSLKQPEFHDVPQPRVVPRTGPRCGSEFGCLTAMPCYAKASGASCMENYPICTEIPACCHSLVADAAYFAKINREYPPNVLAARSVLIADRSTLGSFRSLDDKETLVLTEARSMAMGA